MAFSLSLHPPFLSDNYKAVQAKTDANSEIDKNTNQVTQISFKNQIIDKPLEKSYSLKDRVIAYANPFIYYCTSSIATIFQFIVLHALSKMMQKELNSTQPLENKGYLFDNEQLISDQERLEFSKTICLTNGRRLKNRIVKAGITDGLCDIKGNPSEESCLLYKKYAKGGFGMIISPATSIERKSKVSSFGNTPILDKESDITAFKQWASCMKEFETVSILQLTHPGPLVNPNQEAVAPSGFISKSPYNIYPRNCKVLSHEEILQIIGKFVASSQLAEECGFDGVQVVAANGYLASLFLSKNINKREDQWKGDNFIIELMKQLTQSRTSKDFIVSIKINSSDLQEGGLTQEESIETIRKLNALKIDFIEIGGGTYQNMDTRFNVNHIQYSSSYNRESFFIDFAERLTQSQDITVPLLL